ncbi:transposase [Bradyrhizobium sp. USDA 4518]
MTIALRYVGIDISKKHLDIFDEADGVPRRIANATQAITQQVARWVLVVFEATGIYDLALREALHQAGIQFARINPARARDFARASGLLAKTDPIDARMLAAFARAMQPAPEQVADPARGALARLAKRRDQLVLMRAQEKNRRSEADDRAMAERIGRLIEVLDSEIAEIEADIGALIKAEAEIADDAKLMRSLPGVGPVACMQLIAQMPELGRVGPKQLAALAGLAPSTSTAAPSAASAKLRAAESAFVTPFIWRPSTQFAGLIRSRPSMHDCDRPENQPNSPSSPSPGSC